MRLKHVYIWLLFFALSALLTPFPARADGNALKWAKVDKPGLWGQTVVSPSEVSEIVVGGQGIIYALDSPNSRVYYSLDTGTAWENVSSSLTQAGAVLPATKIATCLDATGILAVVTNAGTAVYMSTDGGITWSGQVIAGLVGTIQAIAMSQQYADGGELVRDVAVGTAVWGNATTTGQVWIYQLGRSGSSWRNQSLAVDPGLAGGEVSALAYSPSYQIDKTIVAVASTGNDVAAGYRNKTWLCLGKRDTILGTTAWNAFTGYPVEVATASSPSAGDAAAVSGISSSIGLPYNYDGNEEVLRRVFVSYDRTPDASDDVYRLDNASVYRLGAGGGAVINIRSIAYYGTTTSGKLLAGDASPVVGSPTVQVRRTVTPFDSSPTWYQASAPPSGPGNATVIWNSVGDEAYCGTGQSPGVAWDESAFSTSTNDGEDWQQQSLIDTTIRLSDIAITPDSNTLFVATYSPVGPEGVWRTINAEEGMGVNWSRQITLDTSSNRVILRMSPDYASDHTIYAAEAGGNILAVSHDRGDSWEVRHTPDAFVDIVVEDGNTIYAGFTGGQVKKSTNNGFTWGDPVYTGLPAINMLTVVSQGTIFIGGRNGEVAYSTDNGSSFLRILALSAGDVQVVADSNYRETGIVYAATDGADKGIWRWKIGVSTSWEQIDESITRLNSGQRIGGLAVGSKGAIYALRLEPASGTSGGITRSLNPAAPHDRVEFDLANGALPVGTAFNSRAVFPNTLPYLRLLGGAEQSDLWSIDTANEAIYRFQDTVATKAPVLVSPADKFQNQINPITGRSVDISFRWGQPSLNVASHELGLYADPACNLRISSVVAPTSEDPPALFMGPYQPVATGQFIEYSAGTIYYWRVRVKAPVLSPYSEARSFTIEPGKSLVSSILAPANGASDISLTPAFSWSPVTGTTLYRFVLAAGPSLSPSLVDTMVSSTAYAITTPLDAGKTYYWAVQPSTPVMGSQSAIANFTTSSSPSIPVSPPQIIIVTQIPPITIVIPQPPVPTISVAAPTAVRPVTPFYIWLIIIIEVILLMAVIALLFRMTNKV